MNKRRNTSIEGLRFVFMYFIVLLHVYGHGSGLNYEFIYSLGNTWENSVHLALFSLSKIGVTGFMFISGYYGIRLNSTKILEMMFMLTFYGIVLIALTGGGLGKFLTCFHAFDFWWFMSCYIFIVLLSPVINKGLDNISKRAFRNVVLGLLVYTYFALFLEIANSHDVVLLLTIYLSGQYLRKYPIIQKIRKLKVIGIIAIIVLCFLPIMASRIGIPFVFMRLFVSNNNILLLLIAYCLIRSADFHKTSWKIANNLAPSVLAVYLITDFPGIREIVDPFLLPHVLNGIGFLYVFLVCLCCILFDRIRVAFFGLLIRFYSLIRK